MTNNKQVVATGDAETITVARAGLDEVLREVKALRAEVKLFEARWEMVPADVREWVEDELP